MPRKSARCWAHVQTLIPAQPHIEQLRTLGFLEIATTDGTVAYKSAV